MLLPEECVTFQVALIGSDGLVVGSDRMSVRQSREPWDDNATMENGWQEKFIISEDESLVCFFAGGPTCEQVATQIALNCAEVPRSKVRWKSSLHETAHNVPRFPSAIGDQVMVVRKRVPSTIWLVQRTLTPPMTFVNEYTNQPLCTGNNVVAKFLPTHLWRSDLNITELKKLALLTIAYAARENSGSIGPAFDVMTLDKNQHIEWSKYSSLDAMFIEFQHKMEGIFGELRPVTASTRQAGNGSVSISTDSR
jgi:hypothetical protein